MMNWSKNNFWWLKNSSLKNEYFLNHHCKNSKCIEEEEKFIQIEYYDNIEGIIDVIIQILYW